MSIINEDILANAIVAQAAMDYISFRRSKEKLEAIEDKTEKQINDLRVASGRFNEVVLFFKSDWYKTICSVPSERMLKLLDEEYQERKSKNDKRHERKIRKPN
jgi:hypothetical protein